MCGIVGYLGKKQAYPVLIDGLKRLEYRGYDSAGVAINEGGKIKVVKQKGRVDELDKLAKKEKFGGSVGIGHTRWATHGVPNKVNAHPHLSDDGRIALVHNGIIENYAVLREELIRKGVKFHSETDTEVLANLIAMAIKEQGLDCMNAVQAAMKLVRGAYAIAVLDAKEPDSIVVAKKSSPLAVGIADHEFIIGSDATPIVKYTQKVAYLNDDEAAKLSSDGEIEIVSQNDGDVTPDIQLLDIDVNRLEKGGYPHFMLKEINEQPRAIEDTIRGRLSLDKQTVKLGGVLDYEQRILRAPKLTIVACGTSWHAGLVGKYLIEQLARIPVEVEYASEYRYRKPPISTNDVVLAISQSGETADTQAAVELAKEAGALTLGLVNVAGSSIARLTDAGVYTHAGPEVSVASTKAFSTQVSALSLLALRLAQQLGTLSQSELQAKYEVFSRLPELVSKALKTNDAAAKVASKIMNKPVVLFLGRGLGYPTALEGALKLKEITYIPAEGYAAGEMKHGPIALIEKDTPVVVLANGNQQLNDKILSNIQEAKARGGHIIAVVNEADTEISQHADSVLRVPEAPEIFTPCISVVPLQLIAYHVAVKLGKDVDKPRNLAKSVTVE